MMLSRSHDPLLDISFFLGTMCIPVWIRIHDLSTAVLWMLMPLAHRSSKAFLCPSWVVDRQLAFSYNRDVEKVSASNSSSWMSSLRLLPYRDPVTRLVLPFHSAAGNEGIDFPGCSRFSIREQSPPDPSVSVYVSPVSLLPSAPVRSIPKQCRCERNILIFNLERFSVLIYECRDPDLYYIDGSSSQLTWHWAQAERLCTLCPVLTVISPSCALFYVKVVWQMTTWRFMLVSFFSPTDVPDAVGFQKAEAPSF